ncbi:MAG: hypothetical protein ACI38Z_04525 [Parafannyhessea sp.]|uniref:hypothetical protein n=1 Tax=Parafannyhessea sp. TaxID=2847324 RepID=UPI003F04B26F
MSLLQRMGQTVTHLVVTETDDGEGGTVATMSDGGTFRAACSRDSAQPAELGGKVRQSDTWTLLCPRGTGLRFHELVRLEDGTRLRVTTTPQAAPDGAGIDAERVTAEGVDA